MRILIILIYLATIWSCTQNKTDLAQSWPQEDQFKVNWKLIDDSVNGDNKNTSIFSITNQSDFTLSPGWQLFFSQLPTALYLPAEAESKYDITPQGGDLYRITTLDSFPPIGPGETVEIRYKWPVGMIKTTHTPHGLYFVLPDGTVHNVSVYTQDPIPHTITFDNKGLEESVHISAQKRYAEYEKIMDLPLSELSPIIPAPRQIDFKQGSYPLLSGVKVLFDRGLATEADHLAKTINQVLINSATQEEAGQSEQAIYLKLDSSGIFSNPEGYQLQIDTDKITITGATPAGVFYGIQSLKLLIPAEYYKKAADLISLPKLTIIDEPRFAYRGQHIDVARNFMPPQEIKKFIDVMSLYKLNKLHFHLTDDEGWRLEIPGLPELTEVGAKRGYSSKDHDMLPAAYGSGGLADSSVSSGTGFYTREEYIELLRYATDHHIEVIPEINGPGHARAAIVAMLQRYQKYQDAGATDKAIEYLLSDPQDASQYSSAQNYHDNVICVCQESTYDFLEKVITEVVNIYREANAPLNLIHTGGDEVPHGAWTKSPVCAQFLKDHQDMVSTDDLHPYFVTRYLEIAAEYGLKIGGWEEITLKHEPEGNEPNPEFLNKGVVSYAWNAIVGGGGEDMAYQLANEGYEVVMCNASNLYFDLAYTYEPEEPGLFWAGYIDTKNAFELTPYNIFSSITTDELGNPINGLALAKEREALKPEARKNIIGIQGALWSETLVNTERAEYMLLPKMLGLAERAWSAPPIWVNEKNPEAIHKMIDQEWSKFANRVGKLELPRIDSFSGGYFYRISPPGAEIREGKIYINSEFPGLQLRYTLDGTDPTPSSTLYEYPVDLPEDVQVVKVRAFNTNGRASRMAELQIPVLN